MLTLFRRRKGPSFGAGDLSGFVLCHVRGSVLDAHPRSIFLAGALLRKPSKAEVSAKNTRVSGTVVLDAKAVASVATYYWQYSLDQQTWTSVDEAMKARKVISGLTSAATYYFRFRALTRAGEIGFSQVVSLLVH